MANLMTNPMKCIAPIVAGLLIMATSVVAGEIQWHENYERAVAESRNSSKPMLVLFTGSDWCGWCKKLEREVFATRAFQERVGDKFVFVSLDFPRRSGQSAAIKTQNAELKTQFGVRGFPTVFVLDEDQQEITKTGYQKGGGSKYADYLEGVLSGHYG